MKRILALTLILPVLLGACTPASGGVPSASVPNNPDAKATQAIVEKYIAADEAKPYDPNALVALYAGDATWMNPSDLNTDLVDRASLKDFLSTYWYPPARQVKVVSYLVTADGGSAVIQALLSQTSSLTNQLVTAPATIVLTFKNGQIETETWYYNSDLVH